MFRKGFMEKKIVSVMMTLVMVLSLMAGISIPAKADTYSGTCGDDVTWEFDSDTGVLTISGSGDMYNYMPDGYVSSSSLPWDEYRDDITSVVIEEGVTSIGNSVFDLCRYLTSVEIPGSVTSIGDYAFHSNIRLTSIEIPESVISMGDYVFYYCSSLESIEIPESVTSIGKYVFYECSSLQSIELPNSVTSISAGTFSKCTSLKSIEIPDNVTSIEGYAFYYCSSLESVEIPDNLTSIEKYAFFGCSSLESIEIPDSVISIGESAFYFCTSLSSVEFSGNLTSIEDYTFNGCKSLSSITIPSNIESIGKGAFSNTNLDSIIILNPDCEIYDYMYTIDSTTIIYGYSDSTAQEYAYNYEREFVVISYCSDGTIHESVNCKAKVLSVVSCTEDGITQYTCSTCGVTYEGTVYAVGHQYNEYYTREATCEEDGYIAYKCSECGDMYYETISATGHDYYEYEYVSPTCQEDGYIVYYCGNCGDTYNVITESSYGHVIQYYDIEPTCEEDGYHEEWCVECCTVIYSEIIPATGHYYEGRYYEEATCTEDGWIEYYCWNCGDTYIETIFATGHSYDEGVVTTEATATEDGEITYTCLTCGETYTEAIPATGSDDPILGINTDEDGTSPSISAEIVSGEGKEEMFVSVAATDIAENYSESAYPTTTLTYDNDDGETCGYIFAGWYSFDSESETYTALTSFPETDAYAKFIDENVLTVKAQITAGTTSESDTTSIRFVSTVDSLYYGTIGFNVEIEDKGTRTSASSKVYTSLTGSNGTTTFDYSPTIFSNVSNYFFAYTITNVPNNYFDKQFTVTPYWVTEDGTTVYGTTKTYTINDIIG